MQIDLLHVTKSFGKLTALSDVTVSIPSGAKVGVVGPNGSGKSTLLRIILGLVEHAGSARVGGFDPIRDKKSLAPEVSYVPQIAPRFAASVDELTRVICDLRGISPAMVERVAARLGLEARAIGRARFRDLSGGMKQKLLLALALARPTALIVLDEPTASLDADARAAFFDLFRDVAAHSTLLLSSHRDDDMRVLTDRTITLDAGRLLDAA